MPHLKFHHPWRVQLQHFSAFGRVSRLTRRFLQLDVLPVLRSTAQIFCELNVPNCSSVNLDRTVIVSLVSMTAGFPPSLQMWSKRPTTTKYYIICTKQIVPCCLPCELMHFTPWQLWFGGRNVRVSLTLQEITAFSFTPRCRKKKIKFKRWNRCLQFPLSVKKKKKKWAHIKSACIMEQRALHQKAGELISAAEWTKTTHTHTHTHTHTRHIKRINK